MTTAHIFNGELGFDVRTKLNSLIDYINAAPVSPGGIGDVFGPVSALNNRVAVYDGTSGKLIKDGGQTIAEIIAAGGGTGDVVGPASAVNNQIAVFNGVTGKLIKDGGQTIAAVIAAAIAGSGTGDVVGPASATANGFAVYNGTTGKLIKDHAATISLASEVSGNLPVTNLNSGTLASATTFWRGDGSWATPAGGGGMAIGGTITSATAGSVLFVGAGPVLAQNNANFFWDDPNKYLKLGSAGSTAALYLNGVPAIFEVPNVSGNNWFEGNAGNFTLTGYGNFGTGDGALSSLTTGIYNFGIGRVALQACQGGSQNTAVGDGAMYQLVSGNNNVALGSVNLGDCISGTDNVGIGSSAFRHFTGSSGLAIGSQTYVTLTSGAQPVAMGINAGASLTQSDYDVYIGGSAGSNLTGTGSRNTMIGNSAGTYLAHATNTTILGGWPGKSGATFTNIIGIGYNYYLAADYNYITSHVWSFQDALASAAVGIHAYNTLDNQDNPVNWERGVFDWNVTSNVLTIGTEAGGSGTVRPIKWAGLSNKATPVGADHLLLLDSTTSDTMKTVLASNFIGGGGGMAIGGAVTGGTIGSVLFIDPGGNLDEDNVNFFWDHNNHILKLAAPGNIEVYNVIGANFERGIIKWNSNYFDIGVTPADSGGSGTLRDTRYWSAGIPGLYRVAHASGDNWFEGGAGNFSLSGYQNFGTGNGSLLNLTTGYLNVAVGANCLKALTTGFSNLAIGREAMVFSTFASGCVAVGDSALALCEGNSNFAIGASTMHDCTSGSNNIGVGNLALKSNATFSHNIAIGVTSLYTLNGTSNVAVGSSAGSNMSVGDDNVLLGRSSFINAASGYGNTLIGGNSWTNTSSANFCTSIGAFGAYGWGGPSGGTWADVIIIGGGRNYQAMDYNYTGAYVWSLTDSGAGFGARPAGLHIYKIQDYGSSFATNYERAVLDWNITANVLTIGTQAGGTGVKRLVAIDGFAKAGAPAAGDLPANSFAVIDDTSGGQTWVVFNKAGAIRKVQLV